MNRNFLFLAAILLLWGCTSPSQPLPTTAPAAFNPEILAFGPYPDQDYNLANELNNGGFAAEAMQGYQRCIDHSQHQTVKEDAMFNLSLLYMDQGEMESGYRWMDSLIQRRYRWLEWYKNGDAAYLQSPLYQSRLKEIDQVYALREKPENCRFHYTDVANFIDAFAAAKAHGWEQAAADFYSGYFARASSALYFYERFKIQSSSELFSRRVHAKASYFESILENLKTLPAKEAQLRTYLEQFEALYPAAIFPDVHFVVGCFNAGGTSSPFGLIIGAEMHSKNPDSPTDNFNAWEKAVVRDKSNLSLITLHELVHIQQNDNHENLLGNAIYEGAADFVSALICGAHINQHVHDWAKDHEAEVWADFKPVMLESDVSDWIGNANNAKDKPADLGYYVGYKICESYYNKQTDKTKAVSDILNISDWQQFYLQSGYMQ